MPITTTNIAKNSITPARNSKAGYALWDDSVVTWDNALFAWDSPYFTPTNIAKNSITPINVTKN